MQKVKLPKLENLSRSSCVLIIKALVIIFAALTLFHQDLTIIFADALESEMTSYILAIPFLFGYLLYRKRKIVRATVSLEPSKLAKGIIHFHEIIGLLLFLTAFLLYWYGSYTFTPIEFHMLALPIFVAACILIVFNTQTLWALSFPIGFLIFLSPPPSEITYSLGTTLSVASSEAAYTILKALGFPVTLIEEFGMPIISVTSSTGVISFAVDVACSGLYALVGFLIFATFIAYITREKPSKKLIIFLIGFPVIYFLNIIRIVIMVLLGYHYGMDLALQVFHLFGGWILIFLSIILLSTISGKLLKASLFTNAPAFACQHSNHIKHMKQSFCPNCGKILKPKDIAFSKRDVAKIAAITMSLVLILSIQMPVFALTEGPIEVLLQTPGGEQATTKVLPQMPGYNLTFLYRDSGFEETAKQDASLVYAYTPQNRTENSTQYTILVGIEVATARSSLHRWETCLITHALILGRQPRGIQLELKDVQLVQNPPLIARYFAFQWRKTNQTQTVLYWFETSTFTANTTSQQKHVKISLIIYPKTLKDLPEIESQLKAFGVAIVNYWQPIKTWSQIALLLSQNGDKLVAATTMLLAAALILHAFEKRRERNANANVYNKLSKANKQVIDAVHRTEKNTLSTLENIAQTYQTITSRTIENRSLLEELIKTEKTGLVSSQIGNKQDEPIQTWKSNLKGL